MRIFVSSTRAGLEEERASVPGLIAALGHHAVLFEQFTAQPVPSRQACMQAAATSDAYLLLLGAQYGAVWQDTGLSATQEEYRAARARGLPCLAFRKLGVVPEPSQQAFIDEVESYPTGLFRASFSNAAELLTQVAGAVRALEQAPAPLTWRPLSAPAEVAWRSDAERTSAVLGRPHLLEVYVRPEPPANRTVGQLRSDADRLAATVRALGLVGHDTALRTDASGTRAIVETEERARRRPYGAADDARLVGVEVRRDGQACAWWSLGRDDLGTVVDESSLSSLATSALRLVGQLALGSPPEVVVAAAVRPLSMLSVGDSATLGQRRGTRVPSYRSDEARVPGTEAVTAAALGAGAEEVGRELALRILHALRVAGG